MLCLIIKLICYNWYLYSLTQGSSSPFAIPLVIMFSHDVQVPSVRFVALDHFPNILPSLVLSCYSVSLSTIGFRAILGLVWSNWSSWFLWIDWSVWFTLVLTLYLLRAHHFIFIHSIILLAPNLFERLNSTRNDFINTFKHIMVHDFEFLILIMLFKRDLSSLLIK